MSTPIKPGPEYRGDFLQIDALLDDEERMIRDTVRAFVADRVLPDIAEWFEQGTIPIELAKEMGAMGLLGVMKTDIRGTHYGLRDAFKPEAAAA